MSYQAHGIWGVHELSSIREIERPEVTLDFRPVKGWRPQKSLVPDLGCYSTRYQPKYPNFYAIDSRYSPCILRDYALNRHLAGDRWFHPYSQYTVPSERAWLPRRYYVIP